jgi:hypothetical protein
VRLLVRLLCFLLPVVIRGQVTLVPGALNDTIDLRGFSLSVRDVGLVKGQQWVPYSNLNRDVVNLLHFRYFDRFLGRETVYPTEMLSEPCTQLLDDLPKEAPVSLHVILDGQDSTGRTLTFYLLLAGLPKSQLTEIPLRGVVDADPDAPQRFTAIVRVRHADGADESYDSLGGELELTAFEARQQRIAGSFTLEGNRIGQRKRSWFLNGSFAR